MTTKTWTLTDRSDRTYVESLTINPEDVGGAAHGYAVRKHVLRGGPSDGVDIVHIDNGLLRFAVLPTRGMSIWKAWIGGDMIGWQSPVPGPVHPSLVPLTDPSGLGWLDGFDELLARCGMESNGAPEFHDNGQLRYGLHGRVGNLPAHQVQLEVDGDSGMIRLRGVIDEVRVHFFKLRLSTQIETRVSDPALTIIDTIENLSASPTDAQMLYHFNLGRPWLEPGSRLVAPVKRVIPRDARAVEDLDQWATYAAPVPGYSEQVHYLELQGDAQQNSAVMLKNADSTRGIALRFKLEDLPCFTQWKNTIAEADGFVTGLEPGTNFPNVRSFETEQQRVLSLGGGDRKTLSLRVEVCQQAEDVARTEQEIMALQTEPVQVVNQPQAPWCDV